MKKSKFLTIALVCVVVVGLMTACNVSGTSSDDQLKKIVMVTDTGGVNDMSFNQSSWEGLQAYHKLHPEVDINYVESSQESDFETNLDIATDTGANMVYGIGYNLADAISNVAKLEPDINFVLFDGVIQPENKRANLSSVSFKAQESAFVVGYIAALTSKTGKVGFVGGQQGYVIGQFQFGFEAGVAYASKEIGRKVESFHQYTESFSDGAKGKSIANKMISQGADVVFHAAGGCGVGAIQAAADAGVYAIGVDSDQSHLAPDSVLTSALKDVGKAGMIIADMRMQQGKAFGGEAYLFGIKEGVVGIPEVNKNMPESTYNKAKIVEKKIADGEIVVPDTLQAYEEYIAQLNN